MSWDGPGFVLAIIAIVAFSKVLSTWVRARHGFADPARCRDGQARDGLGATRKIELVATENERLRGQVGRLEERIAVLERIATDAPHRLSREIDALR